MDSFESYIKKNRSLIDRHLNRLLPKLKRTPQLIHKAMRYSVFAGGKRFRPALTLAAAEVCGGKKLDVIETACAIELIHTYSLIHDDLPAMDDDDLRRGRPTNHKVFGEGMAILAGDGLLTEAFHLAAKNMQRLKLGASKASLLLTYMVEGAGTTGMIGGQVADVQADKGRWKIKNFSEYKPSFNPAKFDRYLISQSSRKSRNLLFYIHSKKTAALLQTCLVSGGLLANATNAQILLLKRYGLYLGLAFQVRDDILDRIGDRKKLGKKGSDLSNKKLTFPALYGIKNAQIINEILVRKACQAVAPFGKKGKLLENLAQFVGSRTH